MSPTQKNMTSLQFSLSTIGYKQLPCKALVRPSTDSKSLVLITYL